MTIIDELLTKGWHLSPSGMDICTEGEREITSSKVIQKALNADLRDIGQPFLSDEVQKGKVENITGPCVLQIQKLKNVASPKHDTSNNHPLLLRLLLTDGHKYINCIQWDSWKSLSLETPPGTKLLIKPGKVQVQNGFLLLKESQFTLLGGHVPPMIEKWELTKQFSSHQRREQGSEEGPPPWIPFGKSINYNPVKSITGSFRALEINSKKEDKEEDAFSQQRMANIAEISRSKEGKKKVFGGGKDLSGDNSVDASNSKQTSDKSFSKNYDNRRKSGHQQNYKTSEKNQDFESGNTSYGRNYGNKSKDVASSQVSESSYYNNFSNSKEVMNNNGTIGKRRTNPNENVFVNEFIATQYRGSDSRYDNSMLCAKPQDKSSNRHYGTSNHNNASYQSMSSSRFDTQDRQSFGRTTQYQGNPNYNISQPDCGPSRRSNRRNDVPTSHYTPDFYPSNNYSMYEVTQGKNPNNRVHEYQRSSGGDTHENYQNRPNQRHHYNQKSAPQFHVLPRRQT